MNDYEITPPQVVNLICPRCRLTWMNRNAEGKFYFCCACSFILFDRQVEEEAQKQYLTRIKLSGILERE
jgi:hypothetical protein